MVAVWMSTFKTRWVATYLHYCCTYGLLANSVSDLISTLFCLVYIQKRPFLTSCVFWFFLNLITLVWLAGAGKTQRQNILKPGWPPIWSHVKLDHLTCDHDDHILYCCRLPAWTRGIMAACLACVLALSWLCKLYKQTVSFPKILRLDMFFKSVWCKTFKKSKTEMTASVQRNNSKHTRG